MNDPMTASQRLVRTAGRTLREMLPPLLFRQIANIVGRIDRHKRYISKYPPRPQDAFLVNNHDFMQDPRFIEALTVAYGEKEALYGSHDQWKFYVLLWAATQAMALHGDLVQCGVFIGTGAAALAHYARLAKHPARRLFLIDTFTGIPERFLATAAAGTQWLYAQEQDTAYGYVRERFRAFPNVMVVRGVIPDVLPAVDTERIALLMIDLNSAEPEIAAVEYFWDRLVPGGIIHADDYGHAAHFRQKAALDAFAQSKGLSVLTVPTGDGLLFKV